MNLQDKYLLATKNILFNNLKLKDELYTNKPIILVYDLESPISIELAK
jgi:hypothetical protein